jgi:hypothetical protein
MSQAKHCGNGVRERGLLAVIGALIAAGLLAYSQTHAFGWDEGYHLLAAQLIRAGKRPYLDFCFPQTPVTAYWNAAWMCVFGESWRTVHGLAALCTSGAILLTAGFVLRRFPIARWQLGCAIVAAFLIGANTTIVQFATAGQPYGLCLLLVVAAFVCAVAAVERRAAALSAAAGFLAGAASAGTLLTAPVAPVLLVWLMRCNRAGNRLAKCLWFGAGALISWLPVFWLFAQGPRQVYFNVIEYMLRYRPAGWSGAARHDLEVMVSWIDSPQALILGLLAAGGLFHAVRAARDGQWRAELCLCFWLAAALALHVSCARPTFPQYYLFALPFLSILACAGLYEVGTRLSRRQRPLGPVIAVIALVCGGLASRLYVEARDDFFWRDMEEVARKVDSVTPRNAALLASEEHVYFLTRRTPPPGMEVEDSHGVPLPLAEARLLHLVPRDELRKQVEAGVFDTVEICEDDPESAEVADLARIYSRSVTITPCHVFWGAVRPER